MNEIKKIYFDLDHTLWDYQTNSIYVLSQIYEKYNLSRVFENVREFLNRFEEINFGYWEKYNKGLMTREDLRYNRFREIIGISDLFSDKKYDEITSFFISECPQQSALLPGTIEVLDFLKKKYRLGILTNGFNDTQHVKLQKAGLNSYFEVVITSESADSRKPDKKIFDYALSISKLKASEVLMIGDNLHSDIKGASNAGWFYCWYNPHNYDYNISPQIKDLRELLHLL